MRYIDRQNLQYILPPHLASEETDTLMTPPTGVKAQCRLKKNPLDHSKMDWFVPFYLFKHANE